MNGRVWQESDCALADYVKSRRKRTLDVYRAEPERLEEDSNTEQSVLSSGYRYRQVIEAIQNASDAIQEAADDGGHESGRIVVRLAGSKLYVANTGTPLTKDGIVALLGAHSSRKRKNQIGRFGLGFKSLLALGGRIDLFSRSVSIRFDPTACRETIRNELGLPSGSNVPGLRMAKVINIDDEARFDSDLEEFGSWATTILRAEVKDSEMEDRVHGELTRFRREFALFLTCDVCLEMQFGSSQVRHIRRERTDAGVVIHDGEHQQEWLAFERTIPVNDIAARRDAGPLHDRDEVPLIWAVPLNPVRETAGEFWAFFHTDTGSRIPGIINAPWKIDIGRSALSPGDYNAFLMRAAADLVANEIPNLWDAEDPGRILDAFPRQLDREDEPAAPLVHALWKRLQDVKVVPSGTGSLHRADDLSIHPTQNLSLVKTWHGIARRDQLTKLVHYTCLRGQRLARLNELWNRIERRELQQHAKLRPMMDVLGIDYQMPEYPQTLEVALWLEAASRPSVTDAKEMLRFVRLLHDSQTWTDFRDRIAQARIVLSDTGVLVAPSDAIIGATEDVPDTYQVDPRLLDDSESRDVLERVLSISVLDDAEWARRIRILIDHTSLDSGDDVWTAVWRAIRVVPDSVLNDLADIYDNLLIRSVDGNWRSRNHVLLPGRILQTKHESASEHAHLTVDTTVHGNEHDRRILGAIGVSDVPRAEWQRFEPSIWGDYISEMRAIYSRRLTSDQNPRGDSIGVIDQCSAPVGLVLSRQAKGQVKARIYSHLLHQDVLSRCDPVTIGHTGSSLSRERYPKVELPHPFIWETIQSGTIEYSSHLVPIGLVVMHFDRLQKIGNHPFRSINDQLAMVNRLIPDEHPIKSIASVHRNHISDMSWLSTVLSNEYYINMMDHDSRWNQSGFWAAIESHCLSPTTDYSTAGLTYEWMCQFNRLPAFVQTAAGNVRFSECFVSPSGEMSEFASSARWPVVLVSPNTAETWRENGAKALAEEISVKVGPSIGTTVLLLDVAPEFRSVLTDSATGVAHVRFVEHIRLSVPAGRDCQALTWNWDDSTVLVDHGWFDDLDWQAQVETLFAAARRADWVSGDLTEARKLTLQQNRAIRLRREVAAGADLVDRVYRLVGCDAERLFDCFEDEERRAIPSAWMHDGKLLAGLALRVYGPGVLHQLREIMEERGLAPPPHWGNRESREFVSSLGFPPEFASALRRRRAAEVSVSGPMPLGSLHDFQKEIVNDLRPIVHSKGKSGRAVISLPTGAGKTRVAVEAAVHHILRGDITSECVLWVAQTDELCEQAVQAFRQVWSNEGLEWTDLRVVRLWGGNPDPTPSPDGTPTVIVASIQTLSLRLERLALLDNCALVMLDECHHAIAPTYTRLLNRLAPAQENLTSKVGPPVIGLTATPFRGRRSEEETRWLANRFAQRMFPRASKQPNLYNEFRKRGILSEHHFEALHFHQPFPFSRGEREYISTYNEIPPSALKRLASLADRNELIVERTIQESENGPVLLFANSVAHARYLSTRLCVSGIEAASIYSETETAVRQYFIRRFQDGDVKVLTNYQVLSTGFDAPKVSTIVISRPVFTPSRYIQMVGRGLRGPKHGGTEKCRIITVVDNLSEYQDRLAYHYFMDHYT